METTSFKNDRDSISLSEKKNRAVSGVGVGVGGIEEQEFNQNLFYLSSQDEMSGNETDKNNQLKLEVYFLIL